MDFLRSNSDNGSRYYKKGNSYSSYSNSNSNSYSKSYSYSR